MGVCLSVCGGGRRGGGVQDRGDSASKYRSHVSKNILHFSMSDNFERHDFEQFLK